MARKREPEPHGVDLSLVGTAELIDALTRRFPAGAIIMAAPHTPTTSECAARYWGAPYALLGVIELAKMQATACAIARMREDEARRRRKESDNDD